MAFEIARFNPMDEFRNLERQMDRFMAGFPRIRREDVDLGNVDEVLAVDVYEKDGNLVVKAAVPGIDKKDIDVNVTDGILYIRAESKAESEVKEENWYRRESRYGKFSRSFRLPPNVDATKVKANYEDGMLRLSFPLMAEAKAKSIHVNVT